MRTFMLLVVLACLGCSRFKGQPVPQGGTIPALVAEAEGKVVVYAFGYTGCPDVCPPTLSRMKALVDKLGERAGEVAFVFVTVDPERDAQERLRSYVTAFDPRISPVRPQSGELQRTLELFGAEATVRVNASAGGAEDSYSVDHSTGYFVVDRGGKLRLRLPPTLSVEEMTADLFALADERSPARPAAAGVRIEDPSAMISPGGAGALYLRIVNEGQLADRLLRVESKAARQTALHETVHQRGVARMVSHADGFTVPAGGVLELAPGGKHVMLLGVEAQAGAPVEATLIFERAGRLSARFVAR